MKWLVAEGSSRPPADYKERYKVFKWKGELLRECCEALLYWHGDCGAADTALTFFDQIALADTVPNTPWHHAVKTVPLVPAFVMLNQELIAAKYPGTNIQCFERHVDLVDKLNPGYFWLEQAGSLMMSHPRRPNPDMALAFFEDIERDTGHILRSPGTRAHHNHLLTFGRAVARMLHDQGRHREADWLRHFATEAWPYR